LGVLAAVSVTAGVAGVSALQPDVGPDAVTRASVLDVTPVELVADEPAASRGTGPCTAVRMLASLENVEMVRGLAAAYTAEPRDIDGRCVEFTVESERSGFAADDAAAGFADRAPEARPNLWIPDSSMWIDLARSRAGDGALVIAPPSVRTALAGIVLAMPSSLAAEGSWVDEPPTWSDVYAAASDSDGFRLVRTNPITTSSGQAALLTEYAAALDDMTELTPESMAEPQVMTEVSAAEQATTQYLATPEQFLWQARTAEAAGSVSDFMSGVILDEKSIWDYNRGVSSPDGVARTQDAAPRDPLEPVYPSDGVLFSDNPGVVLAGDWTGEAQTAAARDFLRFATTVEGQAAVRAAGYRDINGELDEQVAEVGGLRTEIPNPVALPSPRVLTASTETFPEVRKRSQVLFLLDVSGSMDEPVAPGLTKLQAAKNAIILALDHFTETDRVGLAAFSTAPDGSLTPGAISPVTEIQAGKEQFVSTLSTLTSVADTPLYAAVSQFSTAQAATWDAERINAIVLLSDGRDDTPIPTVSREAMIATLQGQQPATPVNVFTLAYGGGADVDALRQISAVTGGQFYEATDPARLKTVLADLVTNF
jgi:Ca-activated chloride channel family protein